MCIINVAVRILCTSIHILVTCAVFSTLSIHSTKQKGCSGVPDDSDTIPLSVTLCGHLKCRKLRLLDLHTDSTLNCVNFDPTYYDTETSRYGWLVLLLYIITHDCKFVPTAPHYHTSTCTYIHTCSIQSQGHMLYTYSCTHTLQASDTLQWQPSGYWVPVSAGHTCRGQWGWCGWERGCLHGIYWGRAGTGQVAGAGRCPSCGETTESGPCTGEHIRQTARYVCLPNKSPAEPIIVPQFLLSPTYEHSMSIPFKL